MLEPFRAQELGTRLAETPGAVPCPLPLTGPVLAKPLSYLEVALNVLRFVPDVCCTGPDNPAASWAHDAISAGQFRLHRNRAGQRASARSVRRVSAGPEGPILGFVTTGLSRPPIHNGQTCADGTEPLSGQDRDSRDCSARKPEEPRPQLMRRTDMQLAAVLLFSVAAFQAGPDPR